MTAPDPQRSNIAEITLPSGRHPDMTMPDAAFKQHKNMTLLSHFVTYRCFLVNGPGQRQFGEEVTVLRIAD